MNTLLLRLEGPMQSWGVQSLFPERDTLQVPSKSGVIGLLCAALGRDRKEPVEDLANLKMGVRVEREGIFAKDFQTAQNVAKATSKFKKSTGKYEADHKEDAVISDRYYLADACFLVGFEGDNEQFQLLKSCHDALKNPRWPLFLGRKSFVPSQSVWLSDGLRANCNLLKAFETYCWLGQRKWQKDWIEYQGNLRIAIEDTSGSEVRNDHPISFEINQRRHAPRRASFGFVARPQECSDEEIRH